jgi:hypothetical protein
MTYRLGVIALASLILLANLPVAACAGQAPCTSGCVTHECCKSDSSTMDAEDVLQASSCTMRVEAPTQVPTLRTEAKAAPTHLEGAMQPAVSIPPTKITGLVLSPVPNLSSNHLYLKNHILII